MSSLISSRFTDVAPLGYSGSGRRKAPKRHFTIKVHGVPIVGGRTAHKTHRSRHHKKRACH